MSRNYSKRCLHCGQLFKNSSRANFHVTRVHKRHMGTLVGKLNITKTSRDYIYSTFTTDIGMFRVSEGQIIKFGLEPGTYPNTLASVISITPLINESGEGDLYANMWINCSSIITNPVVYIEEGKI